MPDGGWEPLDASDDRDEDGVRLRCDCLVAVGGAKYEPFAVG